MGTASGDLIANQDSDFINLTILSINDFHGQITTGSKINNTPVGSAGVLASYLVQDIQHSGTDNTIIAIPGDLTGASPPESIFLNDEPTIVYFDLFSNRSSEIQNYSPISSCQMIATVGNHDFDKGTDELIRKIQGGNGNTTFTHLVDPFPGMLFPVIASNIVSKKTGDLFFPPTYIMNIQGVKIGFIGAITTDTAEIVMPEYVENLTFLDEAESINAQVKALKEQGIHAFIVLLHESGTQPAYEGETEQNTQVSGKIVNITSHLDEDVDIVLSGHPHAFTNAFLPNAGNNPVLVTQAYSYSKAYARVNLSIEKESGDISWKSASIITPYADRPPGNNPNATATALLNDTINLTSPIFRENISYTDMYITTARNENGESNLYDMGADAHRWAMNTSIGIVNEGSMRTNITPGNITYGLLYQIWPFGNNGEIIQMSGLQLKALLEQQWNRTVAPYNMLQISGFSYVYDDTRPVGQKVLSMKMNGSHIRPDDSILVGTSSYLLAGGDGYSEFLNAEKIATGPIDIDFLIPYVQSLPTPIEVVSDGRIKRISPGKMKISTMKPSFAEQGEEIYATITGKNLGMMNEAILQNISLIPATNITITSPDQATCTFVLPDDTPLGWYNLTIFSSDGYGAILEQACNIKN